MLTVLLGRDYLFMDNKISDVSEYFDSWYENSWFIDEMGKRIVREIDEVEYLGKGNVFLSETYGALTSRELSSGSKALFLLWNKPELLVSGDRMGDNCVPILMDIAKQKDITITLCHMMHFPEPFEFFCEPVHKIINDEDEYYNLWVELRPKQYHAYDMQNKVWVDMTKELRQGY